MCKKNFYFIMCIKYVGWFIRSIIYLVLWPLICLRCFITFCRICTDPFIPSVAFCDCSYYIEDQTHDVEDNQPVWRGCCCEEWTRPALSNACLNRRKQQFMARYGWSTSFYRAQQQTYYFFLVPIMIYLVLLLVFLASNNMENLTYETWYIWLLILTAVPSMYGACLAAVRPSVFHEGIFHLFPCLISSSFVLEYANKTRHVRYIKISVNKFHPLYYVHQDIKQLALLNPTIQYHTSLPSPLISIVCQYYSRAMPHI